MDPCLNPSHVHLSGFLSGYGLGPRPAQQLYPTMAMCKTTLHSDILAVSMEGWTENVGIDPPWEEKKEDKLLWRGKTTGIFHDDRVAWSELNSHDLVSTCR